MLNLREINDRMEKLKTWSLEGHVLVRDELFSTFKEAMDFANKVAEIAEKQNHHPDILISYNRVRLSLTTHTEGGLTSKDFDLAEELDKLEVK